MRSDLLPILLPPLFQLSSTVPNSNFGIHTIANMYEFPIPNPDFLNSHSLFDSFFYPSPPPLFSVVCQVMSYPVSCM
ncbi:hypothetical protein BKA61DRAFT_598315, partial [Leptodontidium sp. MPI-SDFR-AT-0119]